MVNALLLKILLVFIAFSSYPALGSTFRCSPKSSISLKSMISRCEAHDTVILLKGTFVATDIVVDKPLTLLGRNGAVIDAQHRGLSIITVNSDSVVIDKIEFRNVRVSYTDDNAAVKINKCRNVVVRNCTTRNAFFAIYLVNSQRCKVVNNTIIASGNRESNSGNGVHCWYGNDIYIAKNSVIGHRDGIYLEFMSNVTVESNTCQRNLRYGLHFMFSDSCTYEKNVFADNGAGVAVMYSKYVAMKHNTFIDNWGPSTYGLLLKDISRSYIGHNVFKHNSVAIHSEAASNILFEYNSFVGNGYALRMLANCTINTITYNTFSSNVFDVTTNSKDSYNWFRQNYWDTYSGYDLNRDGIGDVPHHPVRLYSVLVERLPTSVVLVHSSFVNLLDVTEHVVPTITPDALIDKHPLMKPVSDD